MSKGGTCLLDYPHFYIARRVREQLWGCAPDEAIVPFSFDKKSLVYRMVVNTETCSMSERRGLTTVLSPKRDIYITVLQTGFRDFSEE